MVGAMMRPMIALLALALLGGCGGAAAPGGDDPPAIAPAVRLAAFGALASKLEDLEPNLALPGTGSATYQGYLGGTAVPEGGAPVGFVGDAALTLSFGEGRASGTLSSFVSASGASVSGDAVLTSGRIEAGGVSAGVVGDITIGGTGYGLDAVLLGTLLGTETAAFMGFVSGDLRRAGDRAGTVTAEVWAER